MKTKSSRKIQEITTDEIIRIYHDAKPRYLWKLDYNTYVQIKGFKDANGRYLWTPDLEYKEKPGYLMGIEISIVESQSCKLVLIHPIFWDEANNEIKLKTREES